MDKQQTVFQDAKGTALGTVLGTALRKMNAHRLSDFFIGSLADFASNEARIYFSDDATQESLEQLRGDLEGEDLEVTLESSDEEGAERMIRVRPKAEEMQEPETSGEVQMKVDISGEIPVEVPGTKEQELQ